MGLKSWYVVLIGMIIQLIAGLCMVFVISSIGGWGGFIALVIGIGFLYATALGVIPLILLIFQKTRIIGGIISIIFGIIGIVIQLGFIVGIFLIIAGILALWKKI